MKTSRTPNKMMGGNTAIAIAINNGSQVTTRYL